MIGDEIRFTECGKRRKGIIKECQYCHKEFPTRVNPQRNKPGSYCSKKCMGLGKSSQNTELLNCDQCGLEFRSPLSKSANSKKGFRFCSRNCKDTAQRLDSGPRFSTMRPKHYNTFGNIPIYKEVKHRDPNRLRRPHASTYRKIAFEVYNAECSKCKYKEIRKMLDVHHIDGNRSNNKVENLQILCVWCHALKTRTDWPD